MDPQEIAVRQRLLREWTDPGRVPRLLTPTDHTWQSRDGQDLQHIMAWSGDGFTKRSADRLFERVGCLVHADALCWGKYRRFFDAGFRKMFGGRFEPGVLSAVTVSPSRLLFRAWSAKAAPQNALEQEAKPRVKLFERNGPVSFEVPALSGVLDRLAPRLPWLDRSTVHPRNLQMAHSTQIRYHRDGEVVERRLFQTDIGADSKALLEGTVPALSEKHLQAGGADRVNAALIHLWRVDPDGWVEMLVPEVSANEGRTISVRYSRQRFERFLLPHTNYFEALKAAMASPERLL